MKNIKLIVGVAAGVAAGALLGVFGKPAGKFPKKVRI